MIIGIYLIFYIGILGISFIGFSKRTNGKESLIDKKESNYIKGLATIMVFYAHMQAWISEMNISGMQGLKPFSVLGGMGVLLFFFVSGYGIHKGYAKKTPEILFWKNRIIKMFIPATVISIVSCTVLYMEQKKTIVDVLINAIMGQWFVDVIMLEYMGFFISWLLAKGNRKKIIIYDIIYSLIVAVFFIMMKFNARWYNGLLLFPAGMLIAEYEKIIIDKLNEMKKKDIIRITAILLIAFAVTGAGFVLIKGSMLSNVVKTCSGILLSFLICEILYFGKFGNKVANFIGERSLYIYLCHLWLWTIMQEKLVNVPILIEYPLLRIYLLIIGALFYTEVMHLIFTRRL